MEIFSQIQEIIEISSNPTTLVTIFLYLMLIVFLWHLLLYIFRDRKYIKTSKKSVDTIKITIDDLLELPLVNFIIPAWKESNYFKECLFSITKLSYPNIKVIINAGGDEETIKIADSFKKHKNFIILRQMGGKSRAAFGKIRALNECLDYVTEGLIYLIDADCYVTDDILIRIIYPIVNKNEDVVISTYRPLKSQLNKDLIKYLQICRFVVFRGKIKQYSPTMVSGSNTCVTFKVLKAIGKFNESRMIAEDYSRGYDITSKGFEIHNLYDYQSRMYSAYPDTLKEYLIQRKRHIENSLLLSYKKKDSKYFLKFFIMTFISLYIFIMPLLILVHFGLFLMGFIFLFYLYLIRIRRYLFFKKIVDREYYTRFQKIFFIKMIFYIFLELLTNVITFCSLFSFIRKLKKEKNHEN